MQGASGESTGTSSRVWNDSVSRMACFEGLSLDSHRDLLEQSYALRYTAYCFDKGFLDADDYPDGLETDEYEDRSIHLGVTPTRGRRLAATARIIQTAGAPRSLPIYRYCDVDPTIQHALTKCSVGEVSRLISSRTAYTEPGAAPADFNALSNSYRLPAILVLYKSIYQTCREEGITHLIAAMELGLQRLFRKFHFPFRQIGPETDYYGPVAPFLLDLQELDDVLFERAPVLLSEFYRGLGPWVLPTETYDFAEFFQGQAGSKQIDGAVAA